jgi:antirestriction protein
MEALQMTKEEAKTILNENAKLDTTAEISVFLNTWGNYNENGADGGAWVHLPADNLSDIMEAIALLMGDDDPEWAIHDYETSDDLPRLEISEHDDPEAINEIAEKIAALDKWERETWAAAVECWGAKYVDIDDLDDYNLHADITDDYDLGYYWAVESGCYDLEKMGHLANYIDYEAFGRDIRFETDGGFTSYGWIEKC